MNVRVWSLELYFEVLFPSLPHPEGRLLINQQNLKSRPKITWVHVINWQTNYMLQFVII